MEKIVEENAFEQKNKPTLKFNPRLAVALIGLWTKISRAQMLISKPLSQ